MPSTATKPKLKPRAKIIAQRVAAGDVKKNIAFDLGIRPETVSVTLKNPQVQQEIAKIQGKSMDSEVLSCIDKRIALRAIVMDDSVRAGDRVKAMELDAKLAGHMAPTTNIDVVMSADQASTELVAIFDAARQQAIDRATQAVLALPTPRIGSGMGGPVGNEETGEVTIITPDQPNISNIVRS